MCVIVLLILHSFPHPSLYFSFILPLLRVSSPSSSPFPSISSPSFPSYMFLANLAGVLGVTVPVGYETQGLPVAVQVGG